MQSPSPSDSDKRIGEGIKFALCLAAMVGIMYWWWTDPFPNGTTRTWTDFFLFFGKEAVVVIGVAIGLGYFLLATIWRAIQRLVTVLLRRTQG